MELSLLFLSCLIRRRRLSTVIMLLLVTTTQTWWWSSHCQCWCRSQGKAPRTAWWPMLVVARGTLSVWQKLGGSGLLAGTNMASWVWGTPGQGMPLPGWWPCPRAGKSLHSGKLLGQSILIATYLKQSDQCIKILGVVIGEQLFWQTKKNELQNDNHQVICIRRLSAEINIWADQVCDIWVIDFQPRATYLCSLSVSTALSSNPHQNLLCNFESTKIHSNDDG